MQVLGGKFIRDYPNFRNANIEPSMFSNSILKQNNIIQDMYIRGIEGQTKRE